MSRRCSNKKLKRRYNFLLKRLDGICVVCGEQITNIKSLTREHVIPSIRGGNNSEDNVLPAHHICNVIKNKDFLFEAIYLVNIVRQVMGDRFINYINSPCPDRL